MANKKKTKVSNVLSNKKGVIKIVLVVLAILLFIDIFFTGYLKYGYNFVRCGREPLTAIPNGLYGGNDGYVLPGDGWYWHEVKALSLYYCSEEEAKALGNEINSFSDEGLRRAEEKSKQLKIENDKKN